MSWTSSIATDEKFTRAYDESFRTYDALAGNLNIQALQAFSTTVQLPVRAPRQEC
jgi:hypothetical protein